MRKIIIAFWVAFFTLGANAQVGRWLIKPNYDIISLVADQHFIKTDSAGIKKLWDLNGKLLQATHENLLPFVEGKAVIVGTNGKDLKGFYLDDRDATIIYLSNLIVANENDLKANHFSNGLLRASDGEYYRFVNQEGKVWDGKYGKACDFANGYASCLSYRNLKKNSDPYLLLLDTEGNEMRFVSEKKEVKVDDIKFISQVNDEDVGVIVVDKKVYIFNGKPNADLAPGQLSLKPVFATEEETNLKNQAKLEDDFEKCLMVNENDGTRYFQAKCGKSGFVTITLDASNFPIRIKSETETTNFKRNEVKEKVVTSELERVKGGDDMVGISLVDGTEVLPPQFEEVSLLFDNKALVKKNGKWGMIEVMDGNFKLIINDGKPIDFKHGSYETKIELILPAEIHSKEAELEMIEREEGDKCELKINQEKRIDGNKYNTISYPCILGFPDVLCDSIGDQGKEWNYLSKVIYDDLVSKNLEIKAYGKYLVYLDVMIEDKTKVSNDSVSLTVFVDTSKEELHSLNIQMVDPNSICQINSINNLTEFRREFFVRGLKEGENKLFVEVTEDGCPTLQTPFVITYIKPQKNKPAEVTRIKKEKRVIKPHNQDKGNKEQKKEQDKGTGSKMPDYDT